MANKKINQLVLKTTIQSTDLFPLGDPTTGQLFKKTVAELQAAIGGAVISVNGLVGTVVLDTDDIQELATPTNRYFTEARARAAISLTTTGNSGASTYSSSTGVLNVPTYTLAGLGGITASFLSGGTGITYNSGTGVISYSGTVYTDASIRALVSAGTGLSYNSTTGVFSYSGTVYTDSSVRALISGTAPITYNNTTGAIGITQATTSTNGYLSSTDWNTFNNKQGTITLTTTGTSGAATFSGDTLNIPQYQAVLTNPVTGTGTTNYVTKWTSSSAIGISQIFDNGTNVGIGTASPNSILAISSSVTNNNVSPESQVTITNTNSGNHSTLGFRTTDSDGTHGRAGITVTKDSGSISGAMNFVVRQNSGTFLQAVRITSSANVGIGTTSPATTLEVAGSVRAFLNSATTTELFAENSTVKVRLIAGTSSSFVSTTTNHPLVFETNNTERMRITASGNVGIGTSFAPGPNGMGIAIYKNDFPRITFRNSTTGDQASGGFQFYLNGNDFYQESPAATIFANGGIERMRINASGTTFFSNDIFTYVNGGIFFAGNGNFNSGIFQVVGTGGGMALQTSSTIRIFLTPGGNILMGTQTDNGERLYVSGSIRATGSITANSDARLKKNIERIENALEKVGQISGYTYNTIYDEDRHAGVIAQEIDKVLPEIVNKGNDGLMGVEYGNISALLIEAIKEQKVLIESLQAKVEALSK